MLQDQKCVAETLELIQNCTEAIEYFVNQDRPSLSDPLVSDLDQGLKLLHRLSQGFEIEMPTIKFVTTVENIQFSTLEALKKSNAHRLQFETLPLLQEYYYMLYYWGTIYPDKEKIDWFMNNKVQQLCSNHYINEAERSGSYKYELSIAVLAFNKSDYTKLCVQSVLDTVPKNLSYELILINHGSTDDTQQYFESVQPDKILQLYRNNGNYNVLHRITEGKYAMAISNDVVMLPNAIENMVRLAKEEKKATYIVASTPNISNLQTIQAQYNSFEQMQQFGNQNNQYDPYRHEQRVRLCNPMTLIQSAYEYSIEKGLFTERYAYSSDFNSFGDDKLSLLYRRNGLKCILAKDAYCHHFGSVTIRDEVQKKNEQQYYSQGIKAFKEAFGVDPWGIGFCYDINLMEALDYSLDGHINVLGINCGLGSNPLKIKEIYKENRHNLDVSVYNATDNESVIKDLEGVSDRVSLVGKYQQIKDIFDGMQFHYIIVEDEFLQNIDVERFLEICLGRLATGGTLIIKCYKNEIEKTSVKNYSLRQVTDWNVLGPITR